MRPTSLLLWIILALLLSGPGIPSPGQSSPNGCSIIQLPSSLKLKDQIYTDINNDSLSDLALSVADRSTPFKRSLRIYLQTHDEPAFRMEPDEIIPLTPDVIAYALADADSQPGREILLFTARACFGYRLHAERAQRIYKIADFEFLWQLPDKDQVFSWQAAVKDLDHNGKDDVFIPQSGGFRLLLQDESGFTITEPHYVPSSPSTPGPASGDNNQPGVGVTLDLGGLPELFGYDVGNQPLVSARHSVNVPLFTDFNGDQRLDILMQTANRLMVWQQGEKVFLPNPGPLCLDLPVGKQSESEILSIRSQYALDLNHDDRCDFLLFTRDKHSPKLATQILVYLHPPKAEHGSMLFGQAGLPDQLIKIAGFPGDVQLMDINNDGYPDLSFIAFRPDLLDQVKTLASKSITFQLLVFLNQQGHFARSPDMMQDINVSLQDNLDSETDQGRFLLDYNKDGLLDVLVREADSRLGLRLLRRNSRGIALSESNAWEMTIPADAHVVYENQGEPVLLIMDSDQIMHVRFP